VACVLAVGAAYLLVGSYDAHEATSGLVGGVWEPNASSQSSGESLAGRMEAAAISRSGAEEATRDMSVPDHRSGWSVYESFNYGFFFRHPPEMRTTEFSESGGNLILLEGTGSDSMQIFVMPWDEGGEVIAPARIREDLPELTLKNPQMIELMGGGRALIFESEALGVGATREVWIVYSGFLYQVSAPLQFDATLSQIMATWRFGN